MTAVPDVNVKNLAPQVVARLAEQALTPEEAERRRDQWRQDDEALRQEFLEFARLNGEHTWQDNAEGEES